MTKQTDFSKNQYYSEGGVRYVLIDGTLCDTIDKCYQTLQKQLSLPDYFGLNLDALDEVLSDLEWIDERKVKLILLNETDFLCKDISKKASMLDVLGSAESEKISFQICGADAKP